MKSVLSRLAPGVARSIACGVSLAMAALPFSATAQTSVCSLDEAVEAVAARTDYGELAVALADAARAEALAGSLANLPSLSYGAEIYSDRRVDDVHTVLVGWEIDLRRSRTLALEQASALGELAASDQQRLGALAALAVDRAFGEAATHWARAEALDGWAVAVLGARDHIGRLVDAGEAARVELLRLERELARLDVERRVELASMAASTARLTALTDGRCTSFAAPTETWWTPIDPPPDDGAELARERGTAIVASLEADRGIAARAGRATLSLGIGAQFNVTPTGAATGAALSFGFAPGRRREANLGVQSLDAQLDAARIELERVTAQLDSVRQIANVAAELVAVANDWRQVALAHDTAMSEAAIDAWRSGEIDTFDLLDTLRAGADDQLYFIEIMSAAHALTNEARTAILEALP